MKDEYMLKTIRFFHLLIIFLPMTLKAFVRSELDPFIWLVKVESSYLDESANPSSKFITFTGTGTLVKIQKQYFVLTNTHLTKGKKLKLILSSLNLSLTPLNQQYTGVDTPLLDLELLPVKDPHISNEHFFIWDQLKSIFSYKLNRTFVEKIHPLSIGEVDHGRNFIVPFRSTVEPNKINYYFVPVPSWVKKIPQSISLFSQLYSKIDGVWSDGNFLGLTVDGKISPGMSGSPLLLQSNEDENILYLKGVARSLHRFFPKSYFSSENTIKNLALSVVSKFRDREENPKAHLVQSLAYLEERERINPIWHYKSEIGLYRTTHRTSEISLDTLPAGEVSTQDAGGGDSADGGGGDSIDGGTVNSIKENNNEIIKISTYRDLGLTPGILLDGQKVMGIQFIPVKTDKQFGDTDIIVYAEYSILQLLDVVTNSVLKVETKPILSSASLYDLFLRKASLAMKYQTLSSNELLENPCLIDQKSLQHGNIIRLRLKHHLSSETNVAILEINSKGILTGSNDTQFEPFVSVGKEKPFIVDLRGLFFMVMSDTRMPLEETSSISKELATKGKEAFYNLLPYVYYQRSLNSAAIPAFCKITSRSDIFQN